MAMQTITNRQFTAPAAADAVSVTPNGTAWNNSAYTQLLAATDAACCLTGLIVAAATHAAGTPFEVDIATGAAASEVVIATFKGRYQINVPSHGMMQLPIPVDNIANGARLAVRMRKSGTDTTAWKFAITYLKKPIAGTLLVSAKPTKCSTPAAEFTTLTSAATPWGNGAWAQVIATAAADLVIVGAIIGLSSNGADHEIDIGRGGAGSEVALTTLKGYHSGGSVGGPGFVPFWNPLNGISAGMRVVARCREQDGVSDTVLFALVYQEKPL